MAVVSFREGLQAYHDRAVKKFNAKYTLQDLIDFVGPLGFEIQQILTAQDSFDQVDLDRAYEELCDQNNGFVPFDARVFKDTALDIVIDPDLITRMRHLLPSIFEDTALKLTDAGSKALEESGELLGAASNAAKKVFGGVGDVGGNLGDISKQIPKVLIAVAVVAVLGFIIYFGRPFRGKK